MSVSLIQNNYGKSRVRLMKVARAGDVHRVQELTVKIQFEGDFASAHSVGDNSLILPTDTMKNTVYALAHQTAELEEIEDFAGRLSAHFLTNNQQISRVIIEISEIGWTRLERENEPHPHSFIKGGGEKRTCRIDQTREKSAVESGIEDLIVLKTTKSGFAGFVKDRYTTLPEVTDRIFATSVKANWSYQNDAAASGELYRDVRKTMIDTFSEHDSLSVQQTLYAMGEAVLEKFAAIAAIAFSMPNIHYIPVDMSRFGLANDNRIFLPTDEPHGLIEGKLSRDQAEK